MTKVTRIDQHQWKFENEHAASSLFDILMLSELGGYADYHIFQEFDIRIIGLIEGETCEIKVKQIAINHDYKEIIIVSENDDFYAVNLNESVAQLVKRYWETPN